MRRTMCLRVVLLMTVVRAAGCDDDPTGDDGDGDGTGIDLTGLVSIAVAPADQTLVIDEGVAATSGYTAVGTFEDGRTLDITAVTTFSLGDATLGRFTGAQLTTGENRGGATTVNAVAGGRAGSTGVTVLLRRHWNDPSSTDLPADPQGPFAGTPDPGRAPQQVYPNDGVLVPPNLGKLEIHFYPGTGNNLFELAFASPTTDLKVYLRCTQPMNGGCIYLPDAKAWAWLADSNRGGTPVKWSVRATDDAGTGVGTSAIATLSFSYDPIEGGIYYWTTSNGTGIIRYDFASATQTAPEKFLGTELTGGTCIGCHALSRDGEKLVAEAGGQDDGRLLLLDVASKTPMVGFGTTEKSIFESWNPDGSAYVGVYGDSGATNFDLMVMDGNSGALLYSIPVGGSKTNPTDHPDWSPDGARITFVRVGIANTLQMMYRGSIHMVTDMGGGMWSPPVELVPAVAGKNRYYPAFSPDGSIIVFNESHCPSGDKHGDCNADTDPTARLWAVEAKPGATPIELARANAPGVADAGKTALTNSFPKWSPFVFKRNAEGARLEWITFSSTRQYGLRPPPGNGTLVWMAAVEPDAALAGSDPSSPAFALPFQDVATSNHIAQWTTKVVEIE